MFAPSVVYVTTDAMASEDKVIWVAILNDEAVKPAIGGIPKAIRDRFGDGDRRVVIFESSSHSSGRGNFQIVSASCGSDLVLRMTLVAVFFTTDESVSRVMSFNFARSSTQLFQARDMMMLSPADYDKVREQVIEQLGDQASAYIAELPSG